MREEHVLIAPNIKDFWQAVFKRIRYFCPAYLTGLLFFYCFIQMPLHYDQLVAVNLYTYYGGLFNYISGHVWYWVSNVNGRLFSTLIVGFFEQNYTFMFLVDSILLGLFIVVCAKLLALRKSDEPYIMWAAALAFFLLSRAVELEVISYALCIYFAPILMLLALVWLLEKIMPPQEKTISKRAGRRFLTLILVMSLWLENITFGVLAVLGCLFIGDWVVNKRKNKYLFLGTILAFLSLLLMARYRFSATQMTESGGFHALLVRVTQKAALVLDTIFLDNSALTAGMAIIAIWRLHIAIKKLYGWKKVVGWVPQLFWAYISLTHIAASYNALLNLAKSIPVPLAGGQMSLLPSIEIGLILPPNNGEVRLVIYSLFVVSLLLPVLFCKKRVTCLTMYGFAVSTMGILFFTGEYFGARVITPSLLMMVMTMLGVLGDCLLHHEKKGKAWKAVCIVVLVLFAFRFDYYYSRYTQIGMTNNYNEQIIEYAVNLQGVGQWDYDNDVLLLKGYWNNTELFVANIEAGDPHFEFFCQYYGLDSRTRVQYKYDS